MKLFQIDSFTSRPFAGNPAGVCLLEEPRDEAWMQAMAAEMNLSETAFVVIEPSFANHQDAEFGLRWFTPTTEVDLCGHGTLAAAHALWSDAIVPGETEIRFRTLSGLLTAQRFGKEIELDFPATPPEEATAPRELLEGLGIQPRYAGRSRLDQFVLVDDEQTVRALKPDFSRLAVLGSRGVIVTSHSNDPQFDFVSRYFAPGAGIDEDPVTGSAHCCLAPFWAKRLNKNTLTGYQASARGGVVRAQLHGDRVLLRGRAVTVFRGELSPEVLLTGSASLAMSGEMK